MNRPAATLAILLAVALAASVRLSPARAAQGASAAPVEETVANLAAGRVVIAIVKDAILVATVENPIEPETRPPTPVQMATSRLGVLLGAVEWTAPASHRQIALLDRELPRLRSSLIAQPPRLQPQAGDEAADVEAIGQALLERLNEAAQGLHGKIDLPANEPLAELILADYAAGYGPEVWQLSYGIKQAQPQNDYWTTRVLRPIYLQFWPPEKGQPRTLVEFAYPPENAPTPLLTLLRQQDPRLQKLILADAQNAQVAGHLLQGESNQILAANAVQFLRAALDAVGPPNARQTMAIIGRETGFAWVLPPPPEPKSPNPQPDRPPGAPSLVQPPH
jgi:hypothetical protein